MRNADLRTLHPAGHCPGVEDKAALQLARAIHAAEDPHCVISWSAQERAMVYYNEHGLSSTLDEIRRLDGLILPDSWFNRPDWRGDE